MFILRRAITLSRNAVNNELPLPKKYQLYAKSFAIDKSQGNNTMDLKREVSYEDVLRIIDDRKQMIIDVRNPDEVDSTGMIPSSINIPLDTLRNTLQMSDKEFRSIFKREKPTTNDEIVFYCKSGKRASQATEEAVRMGFNKSKTYLGSWSEWASKRK